MSKEREQSPDRDKRVKLNKHGFEDIRTKGEILPEVSINVGPMFCIACKERYDIPGFLMYIVLKKKVWKFKFLEYGYVHVLLLK